jgi:hypothetical protein
VEKTKEINIVLWQACGTFVALVSAFGTPNDPHIFKGAQTLVAK